ncbi:MAG: SDR family oxidoreductase [Parvibaculaceae bacterium]
MGRVAGKKCFVTGGAQGLGEASGMMLAKEGGLVTLADINAKGAKAVADKINAKYPGQAFSVALDVTSEEQWKDALADANKAMGGINVLFNNAGIGGGTTVEDTDFETYKRVMAVDVDSVFLGCKYAIPYMVPHAPGSIINTSSIAGLIAGHNMAAYNAAKAAVWLLSKSVALHCAKRGYKIRSNTIHPTFIDTPILDGMTRGMAKEELIAKLSKQIPIGYIGEPDDVAYAVVYLASDESKFITGAEFKLDGGISAM